MTAVAAWVVGLLIPWLSPNPLLITVAIFVAVVALFEAVRRTKAATVPMWISYISLVPWAAIVLLPWLFSTLRGSWIRLGSHVDVALPHTFKFHLLALIGLAVGTVPALLRPSQTVVAARPAVRWRVVSVVIVGCLLLYAVSFFLAGRSASALWKLGGSVAYYERTDAGTRIAVLDFMPTVATVVLLVAATVRRTRRSYPAGVETFWLTVLSLLALGSGVRARLYLLVLGWLMVQFAPVLSHPVRAGVKRAAVVLGGLCVAVAAIWVAGPISQLRSGQVANSQAPIEVAVQGLDVVSTGEALFARGAEPGMLRGKSYTEIPTLLLPRRVVGEAKPNPAADVLMREVVDARAGYAAPLWFESALNFGATGVVLFGTAYSWLFGSILQLRRPNSRFLSAMQLLGPVWVLASYIVLSHLTMLHLIATMGSILVGVAVAARSLRWEGEWERAPQVQSWEKPGVGAFR